MDLAGQIKTTCPPGRLVVILRDPEALVKILPAGSKVEAAADGSFDFSVTKSMGPIRLTLPGKLTLTPNGSGHGQVLTVKASHMIGGKVDMALDMAITAAPGGTLVAYTGTLTASGLAGRVLQEHRGRANSTLKAALTRLKLYAEAKMSNGKAPAPQV